MLPNKFLQKAAALKFAKSTSVSTRALLAKYVATYLASVQSGYRRALLAKSEIAECMYT